MVDIVINRCLSLSVLNIEGGFCKFDMDESVAKSVVVHTVVSHIR